MKSRTLMCITAMALFAALSGQLAAQHTGYKLVVIPTFGGPQSGDFGEDAQALNNRGIAVGMADTSTRDPNFPNCFPAFPVPDCFVQHAFKWQDGVMTDLGALTGINTSQPSWVSSAGLVAGGSSNGAVDPLTGLPEQEAVFWKDGQIISLGSLGGYESFSSGIDDHGQIAGFATNAVPDPFSIFYFLFNHGISSGTQTRAFLWRDGAMHDLGTLGGPDAAAFLINNHGQIAGISYTDSTPSPVTGVPTTHPFLWENGEMKDLGTLGGTNAGFGAALWLSNRGEVVGDSNLAGDLTFHPTLWNGRVLRDLGTLGGDFGSALWVNDSEEVVGFAANHDEQFRAFLWKKGVMTALGTLGDDPCSIAWAVHARGQAVGTSEGCDFSNARAFLWQNGEIIDLNDFVPPNEHLTLGEPHYINDRGEIIGLGVLSSGDFRAFLLIPCDVQSDAGCVVRTESAVQRSSVHRQTNTAQHRITPSEMVVGLRTRLGRRYHIPGSGTGPAN